MWALIEASLFRRANRADWTTITAFHNKVFRKHTGLIDIDQHKKTSVDTLQPVKKWSSMPSFIVSFESLFGPNDAIGDVFVRHTCSLIDKALLMFTLNES